MKPKFLVTLATGIALVLSGCGGDDSPGGEAADLAAYLPEDATTVGIVDAAGVREDLELPDDANAAPTKTEDLVPLDDPQSGLQTSMRVGFVQYFQSVQVNFEAQGATPLDGTQIQAAASNFGDPDAISIVLTDQSFSDIETQLTEDGYEEADGIFEAGDDTVSGAAPVVADGGDGLVIFAGDVETADAVQERIDDDAEAGEAAALAQSAEGTIRAAFTIAPDQRDGCLVGYATAQNGDGTQGELVISVEGEASVDAFDSGALDGALTAGEPSADGSKLTVPFEAEPVPGGLPAVQALETGALFEAYECP